ncbi:MAG: phosphocholine cytidylyltransferase family protein [Pseudomonadota bacterium]
MKAIILSAGQGRRLLPLTAEMPKCALPVNDHSVLAWQLHQIGRCDIDEVVVVTGFAAGTVERIVQDVRSVPTRTVHNPHFDQHDNLGTCWMTRAEMREPFVLINGDTLFEAEVLDRLLAAKPRAPITLATNTKASYDADDMKVTVSENRLLHVGKHLAAASVNGESLGITRFDEIGAALFRTSLEQFIERPGSDRLWYLSAIDALAGKNSIAVCPMDGLEWCEIDTQEDLRAARNLVAGWVPPDIEVSFGADVATGI